MAHVAFLLAARPRYGGQRLSPQTARALGRADRRDKTEGGRAQLRRHFSLIPDHWPLASLTRRVDVGDAADAYWLRADPAHVRAGINGATLLACGDGVGLTAEETAALLQPLRPLFGDAGFLIDAPRPGHWYLRLPREAKLPGFTEPSEALGTDVFEHLPEGDTGRRWRNLLSEAEVVLHNHPLNARRASEGRLAVNSLWFWGGGVLPDHTSARRARLQSDDEAARALACGSAAVESLPGKYGHADGDVLVDLRALRDLAHIDRDWLQPALQDVVSGRLDRLELDLADGHIIEFERRQRWRVWRRPCERLGA
jgi:hypothetical protein